MVAPPRPSPASPFRIARGTLQPVAQRYRLGRVAVVVLVAVLASAVMSRAQSRAADAEARWQPDGVGLVVVRPVDAGALLDTDDVAPIPLPRLLRPADALEVLPDRARTTTALAPGEVIRADRLDTTPGSAIAAALGPDEAAFVISADDLAAVVGDTVRVFDAATGREVVGRALVVQRSDTHLSLAVGASDISSMIRALGSGGVIAAIVRADHAAG